MESTDEKDGLGKGIFIIERNPLTTIPKDTKPLVHSSTSVNNDAIRTRVTVHLLIFESLLGLTLLTAAGTTAIGGFDGGYFLLSTFGIPIGLFYLAAPWIVVYQHKLSYALVGNFPGNPVTQKLMLVIQADYYRMWSLSCLVVSSVGMAFLTGVLWSLKGQYALFSSWFPVSLVVAEVALIGQTLYLVTSMAHTWKAFTVSPLEQPAVATV